MLSNINLYGVEIPCLDDLATSVLEEATTLLDNGKTNEALYLIGLTDKQIKIIRAGSYRTHLINKILSSI